MKKKLNEIVKSRLIAYKPAHLWSKVAYRQGIPVKVISNLLNHNSIEATYYDLTSHQELTLKNGKVINTSVNVEQELVNKTAKRRATRHRMKLRK